MIHPLVSPRESKHDMKLWKAMGDVSEGAEVRCSRRHASFLPIQDKREEHAKFKLFKKTPEKCKCSAERIHQVHQAERSGISPTVSEL